MTASLYSFRRCPYAMRARMTLIISGQQVELREVVLRDKPPSMLALSPKGTVPVLALPGGEVIDESLNIMRWALGLHDPEGWMDGNDTVLIATNDGPFKQHLDRYKYAARYDSDPLAHRSAGMAWLGELETRLEGSDFLCGGGRTLADIAIFPFVRQFSGTEPAWFEAQPLPRVQAWLRGLVGSELFARAMVRRPAWQSGNAAVWL